MDEVGQEEPENSEINIHNVPILLDLAFANNVRYLGNNIFSIFNSHKTAMSLFLRLHKIVLMIFCTFKPILRLKEISENTFLYSF